MTRKTLPEKFDWKYYLHIHPDLTANGLATKEDAEKHYLSHGVYENRQFSNNGTIHELPSDFDWRIYNLLNPDIAAAFPSQRQSEYHYLRHGHKESRQYRCNLSYEQIKKLMDQESSISTENRYKNHTVLVNHQSSLTGAPIFLQDLANYISQYSDNIIFIDCVPNDIFVLNKNIKTFYHFNDPVRLKDILDNVVSINMIYSNSLNPLINNLILFKKYIHKTIFHLHECKEDIYDAINRNTKNALQYILDNAYATIFVAQQIAKDVNVYPNRKVLLCKEFLPQERIEIIQQYDAIKKLQSEKITIGMCGSNCDRKNPSLFLEIAKLNPQYDFLWIGSELSNLDLSNINNLQCVAQTNNPYMYFNNIDYFLLTSKRDPCPIVILENLLMNNKVILLDKNISYNHDIKNLENVYVIKNHDNDAAKITEALEQIDMNNQPNKTKKNVDYILNNFAFAPKYISTTDTKNKNNLCISYYHKNFDEIQYFVELLQNKILIDSNINNVYMAVSNLDNIEDVLRNIKPDFKSKIHIFSRKNKGFDIGGLIDILDKFDIPENEYITYIHNKSNFIWREELYKILYVLDYDLYDTTISSNYFVECKLTDLNRKIFAKHKFMKHLAEMRFKYISGTCFITQAKNLNKIKSNTRYIRKNLTDIDTNDSFWVSCMSDKDIFDYYSKDSPLFKRPDTDSREIMLKHNAKNFFELKYKHNTEGISDLMFEHAVERYIGYLITQGKNIKLV